MDKNRQPLPISIVICTHNRSSMARDAINSVLEREFPAGLYELLIVDNASTDNTSEMAQKYCLSFPNVRYFLETKVGLSHARNRGWQEARGEYVGYLDDDCKVSSQWLISAHTVATTIHPDAFGGPYYPFYNVPKPKWYKDEYSSHVQGLFARPLHAGEYLDGGNMFIQRDLLVEFNGFHPDFGMQGKKIAYAEETQFFNQLRSKRPNALLYYDPSTFVYHLVRPEKLSLSTAPARSFRAGFYFAKVTEPEKPKSAAKLLFLIAKSFLSILLTLLQIFKSCTWDLLVRSRKAYPFYQNHIYENSMRYIAKLGGQTQNLLYCLGVG